MQFISELRMNKHRYRFFGDEDTEDGLGRAVVIFEDGALFRTVAVVVDVAEVMSLVIVVGEAEGCCEGVGTPVLGLKTFQFGGGNSRS